MTSLNDEKPVAQPIAADTKPDGGAPPHAEDKAGSNSGLASGTANTDESTVSEIQMKKAQWVAEGANQRKNRNTTSR